MKNFTFNHVICAPVSAVTQTRSALKMAGLRTESSDI